MGGPGKLGTRLAILGSFNVAVYLAYVGVIQRSKSRGGSFEKDGYEYWGMWLPPRHIREKGLESAGGK